MEYYKENQWQNLLNLNKNSDNSDALKVLWVWPSVKNLQFIKRKIVEYGNEGVVSLGCGCGLLEWFINKATGIIVNLQF